MFLMPHDVDIHIETHLKVLVKIHEICKDMPVFLPFAIFS